MSTPAVQWLGVGVDLGGRTAVDDVSLAVPAGSVLGLLGPNGSGKSTMLRTAYGARRPERGRVLIDGDDVSDLRPRALARRVAVMTQESATSDFSMNVDEIVMLGRTPHQGGFGADSDDDRAIVARALDSVDASHLAQRPFHRLSGGERQRVVLARAFAQDTPVLILDEPTNHLDVGYQLDLLTCAVERPGTLITALHDINLAAEFCDHIAILVDGRLVAHGTPDDVLVPEILDPAFRVRTHRTSHPATGAAFVAITRRETR